VDAAVLVGLPMVRSVEQRSTTDFLVTVDEAGVAMPAIVGAIEDAGSAVTSTREFRPSFDDVFATLVARHRAEMTDERASGTAGSEPGPAAGTAA